MQANASVKRIKSELGSAASRASGMKPVTAIYKLPVAPLALSLHRARYHIEIAIDLAIKCFKKQVGPEFLPKVNIQLSIDAFEAAGSCWIFRKVNRHWPVNRVNVAAAGDSGHANPAVYIADIEIPVHLIDLNVSALMVDTAALASRGTATSMS